MNNLNFLSLVPAPVEVLSSTGSLVGNGTGFFYQRDEKSVFFVTNWHVVTGRDPSTPKSSKSGAIPTVLRLRVHRNVGSAKISQSQKCQIDVIINSDLGNSPKWLEHPKYKFRVDVVIIKIDNSDDFTANVKCNFLSEYKFQEDFYPSVMTDVFVVGYPWGLTGGDPVLPLYKRGSVASEPVV